MSACSAVGPIIAQTRGDAEAISRAFWIALTVSTGTMYSSPVTPLRDSKWSSSASYWSTSVACSIFGAKTPSRPGTTTASRSAPVSFVASGLTRTSRPTSEFVSRTRAIDAATVSRAAAFSPNGTESSRSSTTASVPLAIALSTQCGRGRRGRTGMPASVAPWETQDVLAHVVQHHLLADRRDPHEPGLAEVSLDVELLAVAEPAVHLERDVGGVEPRLGAQPLGVVGLGAAGKALVHHPRRLVQDGLGRLDADLGLGELERDPLVLADGPPEDHPLLRILGAASQRGLAEAERRVG